MLRLGRLTDYAIVLSASLAERNGSCATARALSEETGIPRPTVIKLLKILTGAGLARSTQGGPARGLRPHSPNATARRGRAGSRTAA